MNRKIEGTLAWLGLPLLAAGFFSSHLDRQWPTGRFGELAVIALAVLAMSMLASRWTKWPRATTLAVLWCLLLMVFAGPVPTLATALFFLAATALGTLIFPASPFLLQTLLGALAIAGVDGWLLPLPIHRGWVYLLLCLAVVAWRRQGLKDSLRDARRQWHAAVSAVPWLSTVALLILGLAATSAWLPTLQYDDLAFHLRLPWQLQDQGFYDAAPQFQVWALAPWSADILQALPQLIGGQEARGPVNMVWLAILAGGLWHLCAHLDTRPAARWWAIALAASLPLTGAQIASMQTELLAAASLSWMAALVAGPTQMRPRAWLALGVLAGGLAGLKLVAAAMAVVVLVWALIRHRWPAPLRLLAVVAVALAVAGSSYAYAWHLSGNPVLPLFNAWFGSPYFAPVNFDDPRWHAGIGVDLLWKMTFDTGRYLEARPGAAGFVLVALSGIWVLGLVHVRTRALAVISTILLLLPLLPLQYVRYAYPGLVLLCAVLAAAASHVDTRNRLPWLLAVVCMLNLSFQANANWMQRSGALKAAVISVGRDNPLLIRFAPERLLATAIRNTGDQHGNVLLLDASNPFFAEFGSRGRTISWYSPALQQAAVLAERDPSGQAWRTLVLQQQVRHLIVRPATLTEAQRQGLRQLGAIQRMSAGSAQWWTVPAQQVASP